MSPPAIGRNTALTFGVEIEFCIATLDSGYEDPHPNAAPQFRDLDKHFNHPSVPSSYTPDLAEYWKIWFVQLRIANALDKASFPAITQDEINNEPARFTVDERLSRWIVTTDVSLSLPKLNTDINPVAVNSVKDVCNLLKKSFRIHINNTMGVHVHVGNGGNDIQDKALRKLMATLFVFEPQLDTLHSSHRIGTHFYCQPLNTASKLGVTSVSARALGENSIPNPKTRGQLLEELLQMNERHEILLAMLDAHTDLPRKLAYNLSNMTAGEKKKTIEFRQHESTLDGERLGIWIELCVALVEIPFRQSSDSLEGLLRGHVDDTVVEFDVIKVLLALDVPAHIADFYDARFHTLWVDAGKPYPVLEENKEQQNKQNIKQQHRNQTGH